MIPATHPYWHVRSVVQLARDIVAVPVSYYTYRPQTVADTRTKWLIPIDQFLDPELMAETLGNTPVSQEMAVHSDMRLADGTRAHLVMVDMSTSAKAHLEKLRAFLGDHFFQRIAWYASGRSFHGYGESLLAEADWVRFMGLLLLANQPRLEPTVDPRWIGHRLMAGYASLRWTRNTPHYLGLPKSIAMEGRGSNPAFEVGPVGKRVGASSKK